ncbi:hypothetical protein DTO169E5_2949 [Paecilomyces variotii]|nr:hypothetical protein DTO169E5_2949 [Paecilomyces variotii]KAJ9391453.1 hypothetical protein DTO063F5_1063 [Paecilomyces variotii]
MRLRDSVRPPQRLESELFYQPTPQRSLRRATTPARPPYIDFNPNLPPAAFPTLSTPRRPGEIQCQSRENDKRNKDRDGDIQMDDASSSPQRTPYRHADRELDDELEGIPIEDMDNYLASNGIQNTVYNRNMVIMAESDHESSTSTAVDDMDEDMADSGGGNETGRLDLQPLTDPEWGDLSPKLQVEIIENMLEEHSWPKIISMLGLTFEQDEQTRNHIANRNRQVEEENAQLGEMRAKQLEALMRIDNTALRRNSPPLQLVFRKTSIRHRRNLKEGTESDYLLCKAGEVLTARRFLHKRGLDPLFAGRWGNEMAVLQSSVNKSEPDRLHWRCDMESNLQTVSATPLPFARSPRSDPEVECSPSLRTNGDDIQTQVDFINGFSMEGTVDPSELRIRKGDMLSPPKQATAISQQPPPRHGVLRLRIGVERAAKIRHLDMLAAQTGQGLVDTGSTSSQCITQPRPGGEREQPSRMNHNTSVPQGASSELSEQPILRALGGSWSYNSIEENSDVTVTSSGEVRQRLEAARSEACERRRETETPAQSDHQVSISRSSPLQATADFPIRGHSQRPPAPSPGEAFFESRPELVAKAKTFTMKIPEKVKQVQFEESIGGSIASSISKHRFPLENPTEANNSDYGPEYSPITPPGQNIPPEKDSQQEQGAIVASVQKLECKDAEIEEQKTLHTEKTQPKEDLPKDEVDHHQMNMQKYVRDETPEIKESVANVPLHSDSTLPNEPQHSPHQQENELRENERPGERGMPAAGDSVESRVQPRPLRLILRHRGQQRQSMPNSCTIEPEQTGNTLESSRSPPDRPAEVTSQPKTSKNPRRKSAPATSTKQAFTKKDTRREPTRRSERLNGPPNQRVLRQRT